MTKRIVIMAGGTGGHIFPALAVAQELIQAGWQVSWMGTRAGLESRIIPENGIEIDWLSVSGVRGKGLLSKLTAMVNLLKSCFEAASILRARRPDVVLGMGGFVAAPGGLMAKMLGIALIIHDQNRVVGTTNRLLAKIATRVLEGFPNSFPPTYHAICTGNPLRSAIIEKAASTHSNEHACLNVLVVGGSQGAKILNEIVPQALALLNMPLSICHQTGQAMQAQVSKHYAQFAIQANVEAFIDDMASAYAWADVIICRAGAMTVSEVAAMGLAAIFIPLPSAIDDHQTHNANYLAQVNSAIIVEQAQLTPQLLAQAVKTLCEDLTKRRAIAQSFAYLEATQAVAKFCIAEASA